MPVAGMPDFKYIAVVFILGLGVSLSVEQFDRKAVHHLKQNGGSIIKRYNSKDDENSLQIFCREGEPKLLKYYFRSAKLRIDSSSHDLRIIKGANELDVYFKYVSTTKWYVWASNLLPWRVREASFPAFNSSCVGVLTSNEYTANLLTRTIDPWNLALFVLGLGLFFVSPKLAKSTAFFYTSGTVLGAVAAVLVLLFILSRSLPKGKLSYFTISVLWSVCLYFAGESWSRMEELLQEKLQYILVYLTTGSLIAFITCYRMGPPSHPKTLDIIRWSLQAVSLWFIHLSSELVEVSTVLILCILFWHNFGNRLVRTGKQIWRRLFPAQVRLLTEEEYIAQGAQETQKGLEELREYCSSPECSSWKIVTRLKDPRRFASFMDGSSHLSDDELMSYETFMPLKDDLESSDEDDSDEVEAMEMARRVRRSELRSRSRSSENNVVARTLVAAAPGRQGTPRPPHPPPSSPPSPRRGPHNQSNGTRSLRSSSKVRPPINEYLTDDDSPNNASHTDDED